MSEWTIEKSNDTYGIPVWGNDYFSINKSGNVAVCPTGANGGYSIDLLELTEELKERGIRTPMLLRFSDITKDRIDLLNQCFEKAVGDYGFTGRYTCVYPIKVNQQRHLVEEIVKYGDTHNLGLECGSKPELLVVLGLGKDPNNIIICNGFKDQEYIETAVLSLKLGQNTLIVVERLEELYLILAAAKKYNVRPKIGVRAKLQSKASGRWVDSAGARSKFGLTTSEIFKAVEILKKENMTNCLELLHFHVGSQIPSIKTIKSSLKEGAHIYAELCRLDAAPRFLDVGGGLGVDYDGSGTTDSSVNYSVQEYANDVIAIIQSVCDEKQVRHPNIVTEAGRSLVAHHSMLIFDVLGHNKVERHEPPPAVHKNAHAILKELQEIYEKIDIDNCNEFYHDLQDIHDNSLQLFTFGILNLEEKAKVEQYYWAIATHMMELVKGSEDHEALYVELRQMLSYTYFCNFSVFQSLPDSWAVDQLFPVMPIHRLLEEPQLEATLVDLTCDSDGKIAHFIDVNSGKARNNLPVHALKEKEPYYLGVFLVGAYQEILGDLHNLFGDTDAVHVIVNDQGYSVVDVVEGDTVGEVLTYVQYNLEKLTNNMRRATERSIIEGQMTRSEAGTLMRIYQQGLAGYTYLEESESL